MEKPTPNTANTHSFTKRFSVDRPATEVFDLIVAVRRWWTGEIEGDAAHVGAEFTYRHGDLHRSTQKVTELVRGERIVWLVTDSKLTFATPEDEWTGTKIIFDLTQRAKETEVLFTHEGLLPSLACWNGCSKGWSYYLDGSLRELLNTANVRP